MKNKLKLILLGLIAVFITGCSSTGVSLNDINVTNNITNVINTGSVTYNTYVTECLPNYICINNSNYASIQSAIDNTSAGGTVWLANGYYNWNGVDINITKDITLLGENHEQTIINYSSTSCSGGNIQIQGQYLVKIENIGFYGNNLCDTHLIDALSDDSKEIELINNKFKEWNSTVLFFRGKKAKIIDNEAFHVMKLVSLDFENNESRFRVHDNTITRNPLSNIDESEGIDINTHQDGEAFVTNNLIINFGENFIDANVGRAIITDNILYGECSNTAIGSMIIHAADSSNFSSAVITNNLIYNLPESQRGIQALGYSTANNKVTISNNQIYGCDGGTTNQKAIRTDSNLDSAVIALNQIENVYLGIESNGLSDIIGNTFFNTTTNVSTGDNNLQFGRDYIGLTAPLEVKNVDSNPSLFCRDDDCSNQYLRIDVDDRDVIFRSEQDENTGTNGGFQFEIDDDGTANPDFLIEAKSGTDLFQVYSNGDIYTEGSQGYTGSCGSATTITVTNGLITSCS